jgi:MSHA biogenesis protein MshL
MSIQNFIVRGCSAFAAASIVACASTSATARPVRSGVRVESPGTVAPTPVEQVASTSPEAAALIVPQATVKQPVMSVAPERRIERFDVPAGTSISAAVAKLASGFGMGVSVDPDVRGTTTATLRNVTLDSALKELVSHRGYAYQLQGNVIRVVPIRMESRTFSLDYVAMSRVGSMTTVVQRRLSNNAGTGGGIQSGSATGLSQQAAGIGGFGATGGDVLTGQSVADVWQEIRVALTGIIQAGQPSRGPTGQEATSSSGSLQTPGGSFGSGASTMSFPDGSSLVISPMSGLINVMAMPERLALVEKFINDFQASVLRQVMIEAKIVEVSLSNTFKFGIDWSVVSASGKYGFTLRSDPSVQTTGNAGNVNFTLTGGTTQINAVLSALNSQGTVNVLSNEKTSALNNQRAIFNVTTDEVFFSVTQTPLLGPNGSVISLQSQIIPQQISVGVVLDVLPQVSADNVLTMNIRPAVTNIDHIETIRLPDGTTASAPALSKREGDTIARMRAGETMIIGGLVQTRKDRTVSGIPILKDIPLLGRLFRHIEETENRSELVIFLTPTILAGQPAVGGGR